MPTQLDATIILASTALPFVCAYFITVTYYSLSVCLQEAKHVYPFFLTMQVLDICSVSSPDAVFALRVRVTQYPEGLISVWLMLAVKHAGG